MSDPALLLLAPVLAPLAAAALLGGRLQPLGAGLLAAAPLTALLALIPGVEALHLPWLLLDTRLGPDALGRALLALAAPVAAAALLFAVAGSRGQPRRRGLLTALAVTTAALMGVLLAADLASLYFAYAAMTLAAYPLVAHARTPEAFRAGRVYLGMAVLAEAAVLAAVLLLAAEGGNAALTEVPALVAGHEHRTALVGLILAGFAVKAGVVPLHAWLALAHPAAPVPASALLSALLVKAALVAWWRLLPIGELALPAFGTALVAAGLLSSLYASLVGTAQRRAKTVLAYSTVSQMGLLTALVGLALHRAEAAPAAGAALAVFALHHGLAKGALFLACGLQGRRRGWYLLLPALALAGLPGSTGALAKAGLKQVGGGELGAALEPLLLAASALTTVLMARLLYLAWRGPGGADPAGRRLAVLALVALGLGGPWLAAAQLAPGLSGYALQPKAMVEALVPVLAGALLAAGGVALRRHLRLPRIPEGDWIKPALLAGARLRRAGRRGWRRLPAWRWRPSGAALLRGAGALEQRLASVAASGVLLLALLLALAALGALTGP
ncbi:complex I subunit 5 family protein [Halorhodospira neutriphila]|uniref:NADH:quinone oxidoreductase/Mrp antiporter transmembrane domain-containing protein n=1 Tax=Halorhodospira neutriphila TaxID=168379 RepID=A0ABS1E7S5_9GAMM|nr:complex I subunit 5 family protein [Halorhodospira neutriphila]MBK1727234.1 hypothetical protein [Halorhodospira neutriphila]